MFRPVPEPVRPDDSDAFDDLTVIDPECGRGGTQIIQLPLRPPASVSIVDMVAHRGFFATFELVAASEDHLTSLDNLIAVAVRRDAFVVLQGAINGR